MAVRARGQGTWEGALMDGAFAVMTRLNHLLGGFDVRIFQAFPLGWSGALGG